MFLSSFRKRSVHGTTVRAVVIGVKMRLLILSRVRQFEICVSAGSECWMLECWQNVELEHLKASSTV